MSKTVKISIRVEPGLMKKLAGVTKTSFPHAGRSRAARTALYLGLDVLEKNEGKLEI